MMAAVSFPTPAATSLEDNDGRYPLGFAPSLDDVLIGRGKKVVEHNTRFYKMIQDELPAYAQANSKNQKSVILLNVMDRVRATGRFVRKDNKGRWLSVEDTLARTTIAQAFRDSLNTSYRSSKQFKQRQRQQLAIEEKKSPLARTTALVPVAARAKKEASTPMTVPTVLSSVLGSFSLQKKKKKNTSPATPKKPLSLLRDLLDEAAEIFDDLAPPASATPLPENNCDLSAFPSFPADLSGFPSFPAPVVVTKKETPITTPTVLSSVLGSFSLQKKKKKTAAPATPKKPPSFLSDLLDETAEIFDEFPFPESDTQDGDLSTFPSFPADLSGFPSFPAVVTPLQENGDLSAFPSFPADLSGFRSFPAVATPLQENGDLSAFPSFPADLSGFPSFPAVATASPIKEDSSNQWDKYLFDPSPTCVADVPFDESSLSDDLFASFPTDCSSSPPWSSSLRPSVSMSDDDDSDDEEEDMLQVLCDMDVADIRAALAA